MVRVARFETVTAGYVICPLCGEQVESPSGSLLWIKGETDSRLATCQNCQKEIAIPKRLLD